MPYRYGQGYARAHATYPKEFRDSEDGIASADEHN